MKNDKTETPLPENKTKVVDIDLLYNVTDCFMGGMKTVVKKKVTGNVLVQLAEFTIPVIDCNDMKNVRADLAMDADFLHTRIRIKYPIIPSFKWKNAMQRNKNVRATKELHALDPTAKAQNVYYCDDTYQKEAAFETKLKQNEELQFNYKTFSITSSILGPNIVLTNKYYNEKGSALSETKLDCKQHTCAGNYGEKVQRTGEVSFIAVLEKSVTQLTATESLVEDDEDVREIFYEGE